VIFCGAGVPPAGTSETPQGRRDACTTTADGTRRGCDLFNDEGGSGTERQGASRRWPAGEHSALCATWNFSSASLQWQRIPPIVYYRRLAPCRSGRRRTAHGEAVIFCGAGVPPAGTSEALQGRRDACTTTGGRHTECACYDASTATGRLNWPRSRSLAIFPALNGPLRQWLGST